MTVKKEMLLKKFKTAKKIKTPAGFVMHSLRSYFVYKAEKSRLTQNNISGKAASPISKMKNNLISKAAPLLLLT